MEFGKNTEAPAKLIEDHKRIAAIEVGRELPGKARELPFRCACPDKEADGAHKLVRRSAVEIRGSAGEEARPAPRQISITATGGAAANPVGQCIAAAAGSG